MTEQLEHACEVTGDVLSGLRAKLVEKLHE